MENKKFKRIFVIVTDSMGIGAAYDAKKYDAQIPSVILQT